MTDKKHTGTAPIMSRRRVLKWTGALALAAHAALESRWAHAFRSASARPEHEGSKKGSDLLIERENATSVTLPPFDDASGTLEVVGEGRRASVSWRSS